MLAPSQTAQLNHGLKRGGTLVENYTLASFENALHGNRSKTHTCKPPAGDRDKPAALVSMQSLLRRDCDIAASGCILDTVAWIRALTNLDFNRKQ